MNKTDERIIALAGIAQAAQCVTDLAQTGRCDEDAFNQCINSLFVFSPESTLDVFAGDLANLTMGLKSLSHFYSNKPKDSKNQIVKYVVSLIAIESQAKKREDMLNTIHSRLAHLEYKKMHFTDDSNVISESLSGLYQDTLSHLKFRIIVTGNIQYLNTQSISDKIRALLLAGFRAAMLWQQIGGRKWHLIFKRSEIENTSKQLLDQIR